MLHTKTVTPFRIRHLLIPAAFNRSRYKHYRARVAAIIPTRSPAGMTEKLVKDLLLWNPRIDVYVIDDATPLENEESVRLFERIAAHSPRVKLLRTPCNSLKAGALNLALRYIFKQTVQPDVIITLDDDVVIAKETIREMVVTLMGTKRLGAVCSQCGVFNKNRNLLTRLQGLEYHGFNAIRLADDGLYRGPLVMHGMLTAFRTEALKEAGGFSEGHLIEDYEITTRLKAIGWSVRSVPTAPAWTVVPESFGRLWRQRTRWCYGGLTVVAGSRRLGAVFQDVLGHSIFLSTLMLVAALYYVNGTGNVAPWITQAIVTLSIVQFGIWYSFQVWLMRSYKQKDMYDWLIRLLLIPEFVYGYMMTFTLLGSYIFHAFATARYVLGERGGRAVRNSFDLVAAFFARLGYAERQWGTQKTL